MAAAVSSGPTAATAIGTPAASSGGPAPPPQPPTEYLNEVPSSLKQLARIVVRGFYGVEDALIVDMLVRYPCVREEDLAGNIIIMLTQTGYYEIANTLHVFLKCS